MAIIRMSTVFASLSGLPKDEVETSMIFDDPTASTAAILASNMSVPVVAFWNTIATGAATSVASYLANRLDRAINKTTLKAYSLQEGPVHTVELPEGPPVFMEQFTLNPAGSTAGADVPGEVALCISFHGPEDGLAVAVGGTGKTHKGGTRPASRVRGRCYIGPFNQVALTVPPGDFAISSVVTDLAAAAGQLRTAALPWSVWSRKNGSCVAINGGFVDNEWDTVRRRRVAASHRVIF
jgi:hypothetical protein